MPKEKTVKGETYRNEDKIKRKTRVDNLEDFYNFRMPYKDEAIHAKKSMKILRTVTISSFPPFLAVVLFFLAWNTIHVVMDGHLEKETMQTYIFICIFFRLSGLEHAERANRKLLFLLCCHLHRYTVLQ